MSSDVLTRSGVGAADEVATAESDVPRSGRHLLLLNNDVIGQGLTQLLQPIARISNVIERTSVLDALEDQALLDRTDVAILSPLLQPEPDDEEIGRLRQHMPVVVPLLGTDPYNLGAGLRWKADGYFFLRGLSSDGLDQVLDQVMAGVFAMPRQAADLMWANRAAPGDPRVGLTTREKQVLELLVEGLSNKQIAYRLEISIHGAKRHVSNIIAKFHCVNRAQVIAQAVSPSGGGSP